MNSPATSPTPSQDRPPSGSPPGCRAVIYLRVSSTRQVNRDRDPEGISIPAQREACHRKAEQLGLTVLDEYLEPGRSALEMSKRAGLQRMLARIRHTGDIDHVIVYKLSRMARNRVDDALVMANLRQRSVSLISATESVDDSPVGQLMHGILATFNEYQSRESGADIAYKMGQKARNGGTIGRARLGYLNHIDRTNSRDIRTIERRSNVVLSGSRARITSANSPKTEPSRTELASRRLPCPLSRAPRSAARPAPTPPGRRGCWIRS